MWSALTAVKAKLLAVLFGALIAVILVLGVVYHFQAKRLDSVNAQLSASNKALEAANRTFETLTKSAAIDDQARKQVTEQKAAAASAHADIEKKVSTHVEQVKKELANQQATPDEVNTAVNDVLLDGLWNHYCHAVPDAPDCTARRSVNPVPAGNPAKP